jgi:hypothetical protein
LDIIEKYITEAEYSKEFASAGLAMGIHDDAIRFNSAISDRNKVKAKKALDNLQSHMDYADKVFNETFKKKGRK